jgi:hypothetical protein
MKKKSPYLLFLILFNIFYSFTSLSQAQSFKEQFVDTLDNKLDISEWLSNVYGFVPIVTLITEPAVGYGAGGGLIFIHRKKEDFGKKTPPSISAVGGLYTENKTWGGVLVHQGVWREDRIRYLGVLGYVSANLTLHKELPLVGEKSFKYNLEGVFLTQQLVFRLWSTKLFLGGRYSYFKSVSTFDLPFEKLPIDSLETDMRNGSLGPVLVYDGRDNTFTPNKGVFFKIDYAYYDPVFGSDKQFEKLDSYIVGFAQPLSKLVIGLRTDFRFASEQTPFYSKPFVLLRGVPAMRYQDEKVLVLETEERWDITNRWSLVGFAGIGKAFPSFEEINASTMAYSIGSGFRYKFARMFNLYGGIDIARGNDQWAFYIQFGHYWNGL